MLTYDMTHSVAEFEFVTKHKATEKIYCETKRQAVADTNNNIFASAFV